MDNLNPKISIIVPVFNVEKYLAKCIKSILNQIFTDFELILINDGSVDNSGEICDEFAKYDSRIKVIHTKNKGQSSARNLGLKIAKGDYVGFVDSDDWIEPEMYKQLYETCFQKSSDISIIGIREVNEDGSKLREYIPRKVTLSEILKRAYPCNKIIKRELFINNNLYFIEGKYYEDVELIPKLFIKSQKVSVISEIAYNYLKRNESTTGRRDEKILDNLWAYIQIKNYLIEEKLYANYKIDFEKAVKYFKKYYMDILYDYPSAFLFKNSFKIFKGFKEIGGLAILECLIFVIRHLNFTMRKNGSTQINRIGRVLK